MTRPGEDGPSAGAGAGESETGAEIVLDIVTLVGDQPPIPGYVCSERNKTN